MPNSPILLPPGPCFVCDAPTRRTSSLTKPEAPPSQEKDTVRICHRCKISWDNALDAILTATESKS